jgi:hypothetical protein
MPTFERRARFLREFRRLPRELQLAFLAALSQFVEGLRRKPPEFPARLRVKRVQGVDGVWELTFSNDGRATFEYGEERLSGHPHIIWRRIGNHSILDDA